MGYEKTILCLASSRRYPAPGRCVAGREIIGTGFGGWVRPISCRSTHEISEEERRYESGRKIKVLDVVRIPMLEARPAFHQTENHLIDADYYWVKERVATWNEVNAAVEIVRGPLWINGVSTHYGHNDKIPEEQARGLRSSLMLLRIPKVVIRVSTDSGFQGKPGRKRVRADFSHSGHDYSLVVTDPVYEDEYLSKPHGEYDIGDAAVCVSLSECTYDPPHAFKLVATIITEGRCRAHE